MLVAGLATLMLAQPALAASTDYLLKLDGIPGESKEAKGKHKDHKEWIDIASVRLADDGATSGGVRVASGDVNGDGTADATSGQATGRRTYEPITIRKRIDKSSHEETAALLVPAVQKVREAAARMPAWDGCAAGQKIDSFSIKQKSTGRMGRILDATVSSCASEQVSFNFTKIEWD